MALSHFAYVRRNVISSGVAVAMAATMTFPAVALADSTNGSEEDSAASHSASLESGVSVDETDANSAGESQTNYVAETTGVQVNRGRLLFRRRFARGAYLAVFDGEIRVGFAPCEPEQRCNVFRRL